MASLVLIKTFILIFLIFTCPNSSEGANSLKQGLNLANPRHQVKVERKVMRKHLRMETLSDYQYPRPNPHHDPRIGNPAEVEASRSNNP